MARNIEIKAKAHDFERQMRLAEKLAEGDVRRLFQEDTFFNVPQGRLKLRELGDGTGELIQYFRADTREPCESFYVRSPTDSPETLKETLTQALEVRAVVRKKRTVCFVGRTRIHLDEVEGLGNYLELEVVLELDEDPATGMTIAEGLMKRLEVYPSELVDASYVDLQEAQDCQREVPELHYS
jgi:predicted adenylyl cyclase CyaB